MRKNLCIICSCLVVIVSTFMLNSVNTHAIKKAADSEAISVFFSSVTEGTWESSEYISDEFRANMDSARNAVDESTEYVGVNNIIALDNPVIVSEITDVSDYAEYTEDIYNPALYLVSAETTVHKDDSFNFNGKNFYVMICGGEDEHRVVSDMRLPHPDTVRELVKDDEIVGTYFSKRFEETAIVLGSETREYGHGDTPKSYATCGFMPPSTIKVRRIHLDNNSNPHIDTVDFQQYVAITVCSEFCWQDSFYNTHPNMTASEKSELYKSLAIVCRNFAWHKYYTSGATNSFHLYDCSGASSHNHPSVPGKQPADQAYYPQLHPYSHVSSIIKNAVTDTWTTKLSNDEQKLFLARHEDGTGGYHSGVLKQKKAAQLADSGNTYRYILHYFYDDFVPINSNIVVGNGGDVYVNELGDADLDEVVDTADATRILQYIVDTITPTPLQTALSDYNLDGVLHTDDVVLLLQHLSGMNSISPEAYATGNTDYPDVESFLEGISDSIINMEYVPYLDTPPLMEDEVIDTQDNSWSYIMYDVDGNGTEDRISYLNLNKKGLNYPTGEPVEYARLMIEYDYGMQTDKDIVYIHRISTSNKPFNFMPLHPQLICDSVDDGLLIFVYGQWGGSSSADQLTPFIYKDGEIKELNRTENNNMYPRNGLFAVDIWSDDETRQLFDIHWTSETEFEYSSKLTGETFYGNAELRPEQMNQLYNDRSISVNCRYVDSSGRAIVYDSDTKTATLYGTLNIGEHLNIADVEIYLHYEQGEFVYSGCIIKPYN